MNVSKSLFYAIVIASLFLSACSTTSTGVPAVASVSITNAPTSGNLTLGTTVDLDATVVVSGGASQDLTWTSSDLTKATVNADGIVTAVAAGTVDITATSIVDTSKTDTISLTIVVTALDCSNAEELPSSITDNLTLSAGKCYRVPNGLTVRAVLTIEPGVTIEVDADKRIDIANDGHLIAVGTASQPIIIKGTTATKGFWQSLRILSGNVTNTLEHVMVSDGGSSTSFPGNIWVSSGGKVSIKNSTFSNSARYGIFVQGGGQIQDFANNTFSNNNIPLYIRTEHMSFLDNASTYNDGNTENYIDVDSGNTVASGQWPATNAAFRMLGTITLSHDITVEAGARIEFEGGVRLDVGTDASLNTVNPAGSAPVVFTGTSAVKGAWDAIRILSDDVNNVLDNVEVSFGGDSTSFPGNIWVSSGGKVSIKNSTFSNSARYGIFVQGGGQIQDFANNTFSNNNIPLYIRTEHMSFLDNASTYNDGNTENYIDVDSGNTVASGQWPATNAAFRMLGTITLSHDITVEAGARIEFEGGVRLDVGTDASLNTVNPAGSAPVVFTGTSAVKGAWDAIRILSDDVNNVLDNVEVSFGGDSTSFPGNIWVSSGGKLTLTNSLISNSDQFGVFVVTSGQLTQSGNTFTDNTSGDIGSP